jgi:hypothetical protein
MYVVCFFAEFFVFENVHFDCEFCDSILILFLLYGFKLVVSSIFFSILKNFANEDSSSSASFFSMRREESEVEKKIVFTSCSFACFSLASSVESLFAFVFFVFELMMWLSAVLSSKRSEIVQKKEIKFLDEKIVKKNDVSNRYETSNSNFSSLNEFCIETIEIEEKEKERESRFCFESFAIDFALNCFRVNEIENLWNIVAIIEKIRKYQNIVFKKKKKERKIFEIFNQYRENRSISNESDIELTHDNLKKRKLSRSLSHQKETNSIAKKFE